MSTSRQVLVAALSVAAVVITAAAEGGTPVDVEAFDWCADIVFRGYEGVELTDFPALVRVGPQTISGFRYLNCRANGDDIAFADADGNLLDYDLDEWNADTNEDSIFWVKLPRLAPRTKITVYWSSDSAAFLGRNAASVWSKHVGVWHLGEKSEVQSVSTCRNSTAAGSGLDAAPIGQDTNYHSISTAGAAGRARVAARNVGQTHDGRLSALRVQNADGALDCGDSLVISGWFYETDGDTSAAFPSRLISRKTKYTGSDAGWEVALVSGDTTKVDAFGRNTTSFRTTSAPRSFDLTAGWAHVLVVYNGATAQVYLNGELAETALYDAMSPAGSGTTFGAAADNDSPLYLGMMAIGGHCFVGNMDEIRLADIRAAGDIPSAARVKADYETVAAADFAAYSYARQTQKVDETLYRYSATVTFKGYADGELSGFPALVKVGPKSIGRFKYRTCAADGADIVFTDEQGYVLPCDLDEWNADSGEDSLFWVRVPELRPSATIVVRWGRKDAVPLGRSAEKVWGQWAVWHCSEPDGVCRNAIRSMSAMDATPVGTHAAADCVATNGVVGAARQLLSCAYPYPADSTQARKSYLSVPNYNAQMIGGTFVFSGWYRATGSHAGNPARLVSRKQAVTGSNSGWEITLDSADGRTTGITIYGKTKENTVTVRSTPDASFDLTDWTHLSVVFKGTALTVYINGALAYETASAFAGATDSGFALWIGGMNINGGMPAYGFVGDVDELRLQSVVVAAPDALRVRADYDTVMAADFATYSDAQKRGGLAVIIR